MKWLAVALSPLLIVLVPSAEAEAAEYVDLASICDALDDSPTLGTLLDQQYELYRDGYSVDRASKIVIGAIYAVCPEHQPVLDALTADGDQ